MRDIKFRAWNKKEQRMMDVDVYDINCGDVCEDCIIRNSTRVENTWYAPKEIKVMQYTGLKDKNGVEIYEGDIVKPWIGAYGQFSHHSNSDIFYHEFFGQFRIRGDEDDDGYELNRFVCKTCSEVIGNIYEHKELLNEPKP